MTGDALTLGKNFRLPPDVKPKSYDADLRLDLDGDKFEGQLVMEVELGAARRRGASRRRPGRDGRAAATWRRRRDRRRRRRPTLTARP